MGKVSFSTNEQEFYTYEEIEARIEEDTEILFVYVGEKVEQKHKNFLYMDWLFEHMNDQAYEVSPDWSEDYMCNIDKKHSDDLEFLILQYMDEHIDQPRFFSVGKVNKITVEEFKNLTDFEE